MIRPAELAGGDAVLCLERPVESLRAAEAASLTGSLDGGALPDELQRHVEARLSDVFRHGDVQLPPEYL